MSFDKLEFLRQSVWPQWIADLETAPRRALFLHGIMGSELYDRKENNTRWVDLEIWHEVDNLEFDRLTVHGGIDVNDQFIYARSTVHPPVIEDPYAVFLSATGLGRYNFDWRESLAITASRFGQFLDLVFARDPTPLQLVTHSMGGNLVLRLLSDTTRFDERIERVCFVAPAFHGVLKSIRVIEQGKGTPIDFLIRDSVLRESAATFPGLFNLIPAPEKFWPTQLAPANSGGAPLMLSYPIRSGHNLYDSANWTNSHRFEWRSQILGFAEQNHKALADPNHVVARFKGRINIIVGLNGKTAYAGQRHGARWTFHRLPRPDQEDKISNGDGTVLFQSSYLPSLPTSAYHAFIPARQRNIHGGMVDRAAVIQTIEELMDGKGVTHPDVHPYDAFIDRIDWSYEAVDASMVEPSTHLDYLERAEARRYIPVAKWGILDSEGDAQLFEATRAMARRAIAGDVSVNQAAHYLGQSTNFVIEHIQALLMPIFHG